MIPDKMGVLVTHVATFPIPVFLAVTSMLHSFRDLSNNDINSIPAGAFPLSLEDL